MDYLTKIQAIRRKKGISQCYVNLPLPLAAAIDIGRWWSGKLIPATNCGSSANGLNPNKAKNHEGFSADSIVVSDPWECRATRVSVETDARARF